MLFSGKLFVVLIVIIKKIFKMKKITTLIFIFLMSFVAFSQENPVIWDINQSRSEDGSYNLHIKAEIQNNWYVYGMNLEEGGPLSLEFNIDDRNNKVYDLSFKEITPAISVFDEVFNMNVGTYQANVEFRANYVPITDIMSFVLIIQGQACNTANGSCIQVYEEIPITIQN